MQADQDVGRLQIAVNDPFRCVLHPRRTGMNSSSAVSASVWPRAILGDRHALDEFHREVGRQSNPGVEYLGDVRWSMARRWRSCSSVPGVDPRMSVLMILRAMRRGRVQSGRRRKLSPCLRRARGSCNGRRSVAGAARSTSHRDEGTRAVRISGGSRRVVAREQDFHAAATGVVAALAVGSARARNIDQFEDDGENHLMHAWHQWHSSPRLWVLDT